MALSEANRELSAAAEDLDSTKKLLGQMQTTHMRYIDEMDAVADKAESSHSNLESAAGHYEEGVRQVRQAWQLYEKNILPQLMASGVEQLESPQATLLGETIRDIGTQFTPVLQRILTDFFKNEVFVQAQQNMAGLRSAVRETQTHARLLTGENMLLSRMGQVAGATHDAIVAYRDGKA